MALVDLGSVNITSHAVMTTIASLCSRPKTILFSDPSEEPPVIRHHRNRRSREDSYSGSDDSYDNSDFETDVQGQLEAYSEPDFTISKQDFQSILKTDFPKVYFTF